MKTFYSSISRKKVELYEEIASGGEGHVYDTDQPGTVAKIYIENSSERTKKLKVMVKHPPAIASVENGYVSLAWPTDLLEREDGECVGFLMPKIKDGKSLLNVYNHRLRKRLLPNCNWQYLHVMAKNLAFILRSLHDKNYVVGDLKPDNIFVNGAGRISIIDVDSFQILNPDTQRIYRCSFASEEFTPPEMLGVDLRDIDRSEQQDRFGLAVIIWLLLLGGTHPFSGNWLGEEEDPPSIDERIKHGHWVHQPNSPLAPARTSTPLSIVHPDIQKLFHRCFTGGYREIHLRPSAQEWFQTLEKSVADLISCSSIESHFLSKTVGVCHWCAMKTQFGADPFPGKTVVKSPAMVSQTVSPKKQSNEPTKAPAHPTSSQTSKSPPIPIPVSQPQAKQSRWKLPLKTTLCTLLLSIFFESLPIPFLTPHILNEPSSKRSESENCDGIRAKIDLVEKSHNINLDTSINTMFWERYPELSREALKQDKEDEPWRREWCQIARQLLAEYE